MVMPASPSANFIVGKACLSLRPLDALFDAMFSLGGVFWFSATLSLGVLELAS